MYRERQKQREKERKNREKTTFFSFFSQNKMNSRQKNKKIKKCPGTRVTGMGCPVSVVSGFPSKEGTRRRETVILSLRQDYIHSL